MDILRRFVLGAAPLLMAVALSVPAAAAAQEASDPAGADAQVVEPVVDSPAIAIAPTGLSGTIVVGGRCPVPVGGLGRGQTCLDRPFQTTVLIRSADTQQPVTSVPTATDGTFSIALPPGRYLVDPLLADGNPPVQSSIAVDVAGDSLTPLTIRVVGGSAERVP